MKNKKSILAITLSFLMMVSAILPAWAARAEGPGRLGVANTELSGIDIPQDAEVFLLVNSHNEPVNATGELSVYTRTVSYDASGYPVSAAAWTRVIDPAHTVMGRQGMGKTKEGDEKTPVGLFRMDTPFGILPPEEGFPQNYLTLDENYYWDGDSGSTCYNRLVDVRKYTAFDRAKSEHLVNAKRAYNYGINMGYNAACTKGAGSALFLHCIDYTAGRNTAGCVAVDEQIMKQILKLYREGHTYIMIR